MKRFLDITLEIGYNKDILKALGASCIIQI